MSLSPLPLFPNMNKSFSTITSIWTSYNTLSAQVQLLYELHKSELMPSIPAPTTEIANQFTDNCKFVCFYLFFVRGGR